MRHLTLVCLAALSLSLPLVAADATTPAKPKLYLIHEEVARPSMLAQYESVTNEILAALMEKKADPATFGMHLYMTTDLHYVYVVPITSWGALDNFWQNFQTIGDSIGKEKWASLMRRSNMATESYSEVVVMERPDLSYMPATPRLKPEEMRFEHWQFYYLDPARVDEAEQVAKDYAAFFRSKNSTDGYRAFMAMSGENLPLLIISIPGKSAADFYATDAKINATLGAELAPLQARAMSVTRKYESRDAVFRPDLSYPPMK